MKEVSGGILVLIVAALVLLAVNLESKPKEVAPAPSYTQRECASAYKSEFSPSWSQQNKVSRVIIGLQAASDCVDGSR